MAIINYHRGLPAYDVVAIFNDLLKNGVIVSATSSQLILQSGTNQYLFHGTGFTSDGPRHVTGGTISSAEIYQDGVLLVESSGSMSYLDLQAILTAEDTADPNLSTIIQNIIFGEPMEENGSDEGDAIQGSVYDDELNGNDGDDVINGGGGSDHIYGGNGADTIYGGGGELANFISPGTGDDTIHGGVNSRDRDNLQYQNATSGIHVVMSDVADGSGTVDGTWSGHDVFDHIRIVVGGDSADIFDGSSFDDAFTGNGGNDIFNGGGGRDVVEYEKEQYGPNGNSSHGVIVNLSGAAVTGAAGGIPSTTVAAFSAIDAFGFTDTLNSIENIEGTPFDDYITGGVGENYLNGQGGNDTIVGGSGGHKELRGGDGNDVLYGGDQDDFLEGGDGDDIIYAQDTGSNRFGDYIRPGAGNNTIIGAAVFTLDGHADGHDLSFQDIQSGVTANLTTGVATATGMHTTFTEVHYLIGSGFADILIGGNPAHDDFEGYTGNAGNDVINGGSGSDEVNYQNEIDGGWRDADGNWHYGTHGIYVDLGGTHAALDTFGDTDFLYGIEAIRATNFADTLIGDDNDNRFQGLGGNDTINGAGGFDIARYDRDDDAGGHAGVTVNLIDGTAVDGFGDTDTLTGIEGIVGTRYADSLTGNDQGNRLEGRDGDDFIQGGTGDDQLRGNDGADTIHSGGGSDDISGGDGDDTIYGGNDRANFINPGAGDDTIHAGTNTEDWDNLEYQDATSSIHVVMSNVADGSGTVDGTSAGHDVFDNIEIVVGTGFADTFDGSSFDDLFTGNGGNDVFNGGDGRDGVVYDKEQYGPNGGSAHGVIVNLSGAAVTGAAGGIPTTTVAAFSAIDAFGDTDTLNSIEDIQGTPFDDYITGGIGENRLDGREGNDTLVGGSGGHKELRGGDGNDVLFGGEQNDFLEGGDGDDIIYAEDTGPNRYGDYIRPGAGNNTIIATQVVTTDGHADGHDLSFEDIQSGVTANLTTGIATATGMHTTFTEVHYLIGSGFADILTGGSPAHDWFEGYTGNAGSDVINGGSGFDEVNYQNEIDGGWRDADGNWHRGTHGIYVDLGGTQAALDTFGDTDFLFGIEAIRATSFVDTLIGDANDNRFAGLGGNDTINGAGGFDVARYDNDDDQGGHAGVTVDLGAGTAIDGFGDTDTLIAIEGASGTRYADDLTGDATGNYLEGREGDDTFTGAGGDDDVSGGGGTDTAVFTGSVSDYLLRVNEGEVTVTDTVNGRDGNDHLRGVEHLQFADRTIDLTTGGHAPVALTYASFSPGAGGWSSMNTYPRDFADLNGDGLMDIVGFGYAGAYAGFGTGGGQGSFGDLTAIAANFGFGPEGGYWLSQGQYPRLLGDVNGDGRADIVGFADAGVLIGTTIADGTSNTISFADIGFGAGAQGGYWLSQDRYPRTLGDVNGDGSVDIVGFGDAGVYVALANGDGTFAAGQFVLGAFGGGAAGGDWFSNDRYPRMVADIDGDGDGDLVGFGDAGVSVARSNGDGTFASPVLAISGFGAGVAGGGWASNDTFPRMLADLNNDGAADIIGFGGAGVYAALADRQGGFAAPGLILDNFGADPGAGSWVDNNVYPRFATDLNGDGFADLVGIGDAGVYVSITDPHIAIA